jgi:2-polyprenyl-3-methyl-5-hydroxy-6-metoxy-1,4-benzoquinol methylase
MSSRRSFSIASFATLAALGGIGACQSTPATAPAPAPSAPALASVVATVAFPATPPSHDPAHPPIDCPLRAQGIDPSHLKPFEDVAKYIAFLERADRAVWQKPDAVVGALGLRGTETVVDLGAGSGYFTFPLSRALANGKVVAIDIEPEMIRHIHHKAMTEGVANVAAVLGKPDDPSLPSGADVVFVCDVVHHVPDRVAWLAKLSSEMKPGARLVVVEFKEGKLPEGPPESVKLPRAELVKLVTGAGLALESEKPELLPYQTFLVFRKP